MRLSWFAALLVSWFAFTAGSGQAGEKVADAPTVVIRVQSLNALLENLNLVVKLVGQEEAANQIEGLVKSKIGKQGLEGIDPARPFGAYVRFGKELDDITGAVLIPMIDQKPFLALLDSLSIPYTRDKNGIYTYKTNKGFNLYFRFAHQYLYVTSVNTESIDDKKLVEPAKALAISGNAMISIVARVDQIPNEAKQIAQAQLEDAILAAQRKGQGTETKVQEEFRLALLREANRLGSSIIREAAEMRFDLDVDAKTKSLNVNFTVAGQPGSELAKTVQQLGSLQSPLAGLGSRNAAFQGGVHLALPEALNKALVAVIDEAAKKSIDGIQDEQKKKQAQTLFKALMPSAKSGEFQIVAAVLGSEEKQYTFAAALKLKDGITLGNTVHELVQNALKDMPADKRAKIQLDFASAGDVKIHRFEIPRDAKFDKLLDGATGDGNLYLAFRDDALFLALGKDALATLKTVIPTTVRMPSQPLLFDFDVARMAPLMAQTQDQKDLATKLFPDGQNGRVRLTIEGGPRLHARLQMQLNVVEFLVKMKDDKGR